MTADRITEMRADYCKVGRFFLDKEGAIRIQGVIQDEISEKDALEAIANAWNSLPDLLDEVTRLAEDHARMTHTLRIIGSKAMDAMQGTSRSQIAADWLDQDVEYG